MKKKWKWLIVVGIVLVCLYVVFFVPLFTVTYLQGVWCNSDVCYNFRSNNTVVMTNSLRMQTEMKYEIEGNNIKIMLGPKGSAAMVLTKNPDGSIDGGLAGKLTARNVDGTPKQK